ncbi:MAG: nuclear transport factor 2 family protein [Terracidiphilus sp.]
MNKRFLVRTMLLLVPALAIGSFVASGQAKPESNPGAQASSELVATITGLDAALFDAYNRCDLEKFGSSLADDLEFYHDQGGLAVGKQKTIDGVRNNICGKVRRELVPGTLEVYPIHGYGAVEMGVHRFYHPGMQPDAPGEAKFVHIWQLKDGVWKVTRVISVDHHGLPQ